MDVAVPPSLGNPGSKPPLHVIGPIVHIQRVGVDDRVNGSMQMALLGVGGGAWAGQEENTNKDMLLVT